MGAGDQDLYENSGATAAAGCSPIQQSQLMVWHRSTLPVLRDCME